MNQYLKPYFPGKVLGRWSFPDIKSDMTTGVRSDITSDMTSAVTVVLLFVTAASQIVLPA